MQLDKRIIKRTLERNRLARIELILTERGVTAVAYPASYHPIVQQRRDAMLAKMRDEGITSIGLMSAEADRLHAGVLDPVARVTAETVEDVSVALAVALKAV